jgi:hypothetical protein
MINSVAPSNEFTSRQILTFMNWIVSRWVFERQSGLYAIITSMSENTYYKEDGETVLSVEHVATLQCLVELSQPALSLSVSVTY